MFHIARSGAHLLSPHHKYGQVYSHDGLDFTYAPLIPETLYAPLHPCLRVQQVLQWVDCWWNRGRLDAWGPYISLLREPSNELVLVGDHTVPSLIAVCTCVEAISKYEVDWCRISLVIADRAYCSGYELMEIAVLLGKRLQFTRDLRRHLVDVRNESTHFLCINDCHPVQDLLYSNYRPVELTEQITTWTDQVRLLEAFTSELSEIDRIDLAIVRALSDEWQPAAAVIGRAVDQLDPRLRVPTSYLYTRALRSSDHALLVPMDISCLNAAPLMHARITGEVRIRYTEFRISAEGCALKGVALHEEINSDSVKTSELVMRNCVRR